MVGQLAFENEDNLGRWEPWVRASVIDFEVFSRLAFTTDNVDTATLSSFQSPPANGAYYPLVTIRRPGQDVFEQQQLKFLDTYSDLRVDRAPEILSQEEGSLTFLASVPYLQSDRTRWTLELLAAALRLAKFAEMQFKHSLACRRPNEYSPQVQPMILTPSHGSFPMGHATEAFVSAYVLWGLLQQSGTAPYTNANNNPTWPTWGTQLMRLAARVATNRIVAGLHFPVDAAAGMVLGLTLGQYFVNWCSLGSRNPPVPTYLPWTFDGTLFTNAGGLDGDFHWDALFNQATGAQTATIYASQTPTPAGAAVPWPPLTTNKILNWLWNQALAEWK